MIHTLLIILLICGCVITATVTLGITLIILTLIFGN